MPSRVHHDSDSDSDSDVEDSKKYGEPHKYDPKFKGPIENRGCTDIICCLIFIAFLVGEGFIAYIAFTNGNPDNVLKPEDYLGQICGETEAVVNKTNLFYFDFLDCLSSSSLFTLRCPTTRVCVEKCSTETYSIYDKYAREMDSTNPSDIDWNDFVCRYDVDPETVVQNGTTIRYLLDENLCTGYYWESDVFEKRCIPSVLLSDGNMTEVTTPHNRNLTQEEYDNGVTLLNRLQSSTTLSRIIDDFWETWPYIMGFLAVMAILAFICLILMRWLTTLIVLASFGLSMVAFIWGSYYTWTKWICYQNEEPECIPVDINDPDFDYYSLESYAQLSTTWLVFAIILTMLGFIELLIALTMCKRFRIALNLLELASDALPYMICTLFWPAVPFVLTLGYVFFWAVVTAFLASSSTITYEIYNAPNSSTYQNGDSCSPETFTVDPLQTTRCEPVDYGVENYYIAFHIYNLISLFWMVNFILALGEMTLAGAFASFYWAKPKPDAVPNFPLFSSFYRSLRYHTGSLAFGSLIISIVELIRAILVYIEDQVSAAENCCTKFVFKCCQCCLWCLEKFLRFINRNAYIDIAVYGHSFCKAARHVFNLLMRNILRVAVLNSVTSFMLFVLKVMITTLVTVGSFYFFSWTSSQTGEGEILPSTNYLWAPVVVVGVLSYAICTAFFSVYDMAVDTMFISFLEDIERNDGSPERPYYMPNGLLSLIGKKNRKK
ncbi:Choline transporter-like protein 2 [Holothuria leucospilota]|uniref:Choline transporter-like protein n=1 Tax=Holothuria leucospilota TaxID=206669 RepID=A0A9Q1CIJ0_HOLLE|nr:Choline transporter-like protein 2 [Holothuria leucospilota]